MLIFTAVGVFYVGFWLALAMLFSLLFQKTVTAALASMAVWLFMFLFIPIITQAIAGVIVPDASTPEALARQADIAEPPRPYLSKHIVLQESVQHSAESRRARLGPGVTKPSGRNSADAIGAGPESESHLAAHHDDLRVGRRLLFGISYIIFMRAEIRA